MFQTNPEWVGPFSNAKILFVLINLHRWWPTWVKTVYKPVKFSWIFFRKLINLAKKVKHNLKHAKKTKTCRKVAEQLVAKPNRDQCGFLFPPLTSLRHNEAFANFKSKYWNIPRFLKTGLEKFYSFYYLAILNNKKIIQRQIKSLYLTPGNKLKVPRSSFTLVQI